MNRKGLSMISLMITIAVIIIIASIVIYQGFSKSMDQAVFSKVYNEMNEVTTAISERNAAHKINNLSYPYVGTKLTDATAITANGISYGEGYYLVSREDFVNSLRVTNVTRDYIVRYDTEEIISKDPIYIGEKAIYTIEQLVENELNGELITKEGEYDKDKGVNKPILTRGMIPVKYVSGAWVVTNEDDPDWYDYSADVNKWANVMLLDGIEIQGMTNSEVRNSTIDDMQGKEVSKESSQFVWIPRYTYKEAGEKYDVVYSKLTSDYLANGYLKNPAFYFGEYTGAETDTSPNTGYKAGGKELMGIWISKYDAGYAAE